LRVIGDRTVCVCHGGGEIVWFEAMKQGGGGGKMDAWREVESAYWGQDRRCLLLTLAREGGCRCLSFRSVLK